MTLRCAGCGSTETLQQIRAKHPEAIACCPERKMENVCPSCDGRIDEWWSYCAACGYHLAANS